MALDCRCHRISDPAHDPLHELRVRPFLELATPGEAGAENRDHLPCIGNGFSAVRCGGLGFMVRCRITLRRRGRRPNGNGGRQRRILIEDRTVELVQRRPGVDPQLVDQGFARGGVHIERLGLASRPVQREHQLTAQALSQRVLARQLLQFPDEAAIVTTAEVGIDPVFCGRET